MSGAAPTREVAYRVFADEFADATYRYAESDEDRAPQYLVTPTGARINRVFVVGVLTETEEVSDGVLRARIVDPTGAFVLYAGQYQPDALAFFERADPPSFVALTGKARTFEPEGSDRILTSLRPERVNEVNSETRDSWVVQTALHTLERTGVLDRALNLDARGDELRSILTSAGVESGLAAGIPHAIREYEPTTGYLAAMQEMALDAVRVMAGEKDEVAGVSMGPNEGGSGTVLTGFADISLDATAAETPSPADESGEPTEEPGPTEPAVIEPGEEPSSPAEESAEEAEANTESSADSVPGESTTTDEPSPPTDSEAPEADGQASEEEPVEPEPEQTAEAGAEIGSGEAEEPPAEVESEEAEEPPAEVESEEAEEPPADVGSGETEEPPAEIEPGGAEETPTATEPEESDELYELSEEERAEVEENFDVGFESGTEIGSPEETEDIEPEAGAPPEPESMSEETESTAEETESTPEEAPRDDSEAESETQEEAGEAEAPAETEPAAEETASETAETPENEAEEFTEGELQNLVVETLQELGDGAGVPRSELIETLQDRHGLEEADIEEAIQAALLGGRCFESGAEDLKPI